VLDAAISALSLRIGGGACLLWRDHFSTAESLASLRVLFADHSHRSGPCVSRAPVHRAHDSNGSFDWFLGNILDTSATRVLFASIGVLSGVINVGVVTSECTSVHTTGLNSFDLGGRPLLLGDYRAPKHRAGLDEVIIGVLLSGNEGDECESTESFHL